MTRIYFNKRALPLPLESDNGLSPEWHRAITWFKELRYKVKLGEQIEVKLEWKYGNFS